MSQQGQYPNNSNQQRPYSSDGQSSSSSTNAVHMPYMKNNDYRKFLQMATQTEPITFNDLASVRSFKINTEREYQMTVLLAHTLNEEMTKYRLSKTSPELIDALENAFSSRSGRPSQADSDLWSMSTNN